MSTALVCYRLSHSTAGKHGKLQTNHVTVKWVRRYQCSIKVHINQSINQSIYLANCATTKMNVNKTM